MRRTQPPTRRKIAAIGVVCCLATLWAGCWGSAEARGPHSQGKPDYKRQVEQLEELWRVAQLNGDAAAMDKLLSDDYIGITMNGQIVTKSQQLQRMRTRQFELSKIELSDVKVKLIGNMAVVTSEAQVEGTNEGASLHGTYRYTRVYTRLPSGTWKITNFEATRVGPPRDRRSSDHAQLPEAKPQN